MADADARIDVKGGLVGHSSIIGSGSECRTPKSKRRTKDRSPAHFTSAFGVRHSAFFWRQSPRENSMVSRVGLCYTSAHQWNRPRGPGPDERIYARLLQAYQNHRDDRALHRKSQQTQTTHRQRRRCHSPEHGPWKPGEWVTSIVGRIRDVSREVERHVAVMMDVKGPEIRTGVVSEPIELKTGDLFEFYTQSPSENLRGVSVNYPGLPNDVQVGNTVLLDSGLIRLEVMSKDATHVCCKVLTPGKCGSRRHINLPGVDVNLPSLTEKDERDIRVGVAAGIDFVALSFVRRSDDVLVLRALLDHLGSKARIIAKIEDQGGLRNLGGS